MQQHGPWQIVQSHEVYRDPWIAVRKDDVIRPDGQPPPLRFQVLEPVLGYTPPQTPTVPSGRFSPARAALVLILTVAIAASSLLMAGPQIVLIVPLALVLGLVFVFRRSFWSLVCFGYPFTFGLISAWIGYKEMPGYERSPAFAVSIGIGLVGGALIAAGLGTVLAGRSGNR